MKRYLLLLAVFLACGLGFSVEGKKKSCPGGYRARTDADCMLLFPALLKDGCESVVTGSRTLPNGQQVKVYEFKSNGLKVICIDL